MRKSLFIVLLLLLTFTIAHAQSSDEAYIIRDTLDIEHDELVRSANIFRYDSPPTVAVIALHSFFSSPQAMEAISGLNDLASQYGWMMVYPSAVEVYWDDGRTEVNLPPVNDVIDDAGYLARLSETLRADYNLEKVFLVGHAQGGTMAMTAFCETPDMYDGVAVVGALMWGYQAEACNTSTSTDTNMIFVHGTDDHIYWQEGRQFIQGNWQIYSAQATRDFWQNYQGCDDFTEMPVGSATLYSTTNCENDSAIAFLSIERGSNNWTHGREVAVNPLGIDTAQVIGGFFNGVDDWQDWAIQPEPTIEFPRSYALYIPSTYDPDTPAPVVISLHGRGANNFSQAVSSGYNAVAEEHGFIVVYPQAYDLFYNDPSQADATWNYFYGTNIPIGDAWDDDQFLDTIVDELAPVLNIDMQRLYLSGLSNGGYMTNRLACTRGDRYAAFASVAASAPFGLGTLCDRDVHAPILFYQGTADTISPWNGIIDVNPRTGQQFYTVLPMPNTISFWLAQNGCDLSYDVTNVDSSDPDSDVMRVRYTNCPDDSGVELYAVLGGGHIWHGVNDFESTLLGEVNMDVNASEAIWSFFSPFTLDGRDESLASDFDLGEPDTEGFGFPNIPVIVDQPIRVQG